MIPKRLLTFLIVFILVAGLLGIPTASGGVAAAGDPTATVRASVKDTTLDEANDESANASISADGNVIAFESKAGNLTDVIDTNSDWDIFVHKVDTGETILVSVATGGGAGNGASHNASISADGRYVAFDSYAWNLVSGDSGAGYRDIFVRDLQGGTTTRVSVNSSGAAATWHSENPSISANGRYVAFESKATNLITSDTNGGTKDIFVRDTVGHSTTLVSKRDSGSQTSVDSLNAAISGDGLSVTFETDDANMVSDDGNSTADVFVRDLTGAHTYLISLATDGTSSGNGGSMWASISYDGQFVAFSSAATDLVDGDLNDWMDVFLRNRTTNETTLVSVSSLGVQGDDESYTALALSRGGSISGNGRYVTFNSYASNLVAGDSNHYMDVFLRDTQESTTVRISIDSHGGQAAGGNSFNPVITSSGYFAAFESEAVDLVDADNNGKRDIFRVPAGEQEALTRLEVSIASIGGGTGSVSDTLDPHGIDNCTSSCVHFFDPNVNPTVTLSAVADPGSHFIGWNVIGLSGVCTDTGPCEVDLSQGRQVTATFSTATQYTLSVNKVGSGSVTSNVGDIDCGPTCSADYDVGTVVTLTASPLDGMTFIGWSGVTCPGRGTCAVTMTATHTVTATFRFLLALPLVGK